MCVAVGCHNVFVQAKSGAKRSYCSQDCVRREFRRRERAKREARNPSWDTEQVREVREQALDVLTAHQLANDRTAAFLSRLLAPYAHTPIDSSESTTLIDTRAALQVAERDGAATVRVPYTTLLRLVAIASGAP